jgi:hypothetical protein
MGLRQSIPYIVGCAAVMGAAYGLWYEFGPEGAKPDRYAMRKYRLSSLTEDNLRELIAEARKDRAAALAQESEGIVKGWAVSKQEEEDYEERYRAWQTETAQCHSDEVFKLKHEDLCNSPPASPHRSQGLTLGGSSVASEEQYIEWEIMFYCDLAQTVREARRYGCLPPK